MRSVNIKLPTRWLELDNAQLLFVAKLFLSPFAETRHRFLTHALIRFAKVKIRKLFAGAQYLITIPREKPFLVSAGKLISILENLDWMLQEVTEVNPIKRIRNARPVNYRLYKTKFIQFLTAEIFFTAYSQTRKVEHLNNLVATLYLRPGQSFDDSLVKSRARYFRFVSIYKKYTVYLWYSGFRWYAAQECPNMFQKSEGAEKVQIKEHVMNMIRGLTEGDVTKNVMVTNQVETWDALYELDSKVKHINEMKQKSNIK